MVKKFQQLLLLTRKGTAVYIWSSCNQLVKRVSFYPNRSLVSTSRLIPLSPCGFVWHFPPEKTSQLQRQYPLSPWLTVYERRVLNRGRHCKKRHSLDNIFETNSSVVSGHNFNSLLFSRTKGSDQIVYCQGKIFKFLWFMPPSEDFKTFASFFTQAS